MTGLSHSLNIGSQSLYANQQGIDTTAHNIANAQTEGYSRQRLHLLQRDPVSKQGVLLGSGVYVGSIDRVHNKFVEKQVNIANASTENSRARFDALDRLGAIFSPELQNSVASQINQFFNAWQNLSKYPEELTVRTEVREQGKNLADAFRRTDQEIRRQRSGSRAPGHQQSRRTLPIRKRRHPGAVHRRGQELGTQPTRVVTR